MIKASDAIAYGRSLLGTPYGSGTGQLDCINFVKKIIRDCPGGDKRYTDAHVPALWASYTSSHKYQHLTWRQESIDGAQPGMLAFKGQPLGHDGQPHHVGIVSGCGTVIHASSAEGMVVETDLTNSQWTLLGVSSMITPEDAQPDPEPARDVYTAQVIPLTNDHPVNLRTGPSTGDAVIAKVPVWTVVEVQHSYDDGWSYIDTGTRHGYMMTKYLQAIEDHQTEPGEDPGEDPDEWLVDPYMISDTGAVISLQGRWRIAVD